MNKYDEIKMLYEKSGDSYHGGYVLEENNNDKYLGGKEKEKSILSRYDKMVVPFGLFYKNRTNDIHEHVVNKLLDKETETECIQPDVFDRLFYAVGRIEIPKKQKYSDNNKTKKKI